MRVGLDVGSTTIKCVVLNENDDIVYSSYERHFSKIVEKTVELLEKLKNEFYFLLSENIKSVNHNSKSSAVSYSLSLHKGIYEIYYIP